MLVLTAVIAAGCGGSGTGSGAAAAGAALFSRDCGFCHSLTGRQSPRHQGGDLLAYHMSRAEMLEFVREMPVRHPLSQAQLAAVADYVLAAQAKARARPSS
jgi:mono/diheme cytochrome c family protein